jgi:hypothetical protein
VRALAIALGAAVLAVPAAAAPAATAGKMAYVHGRSGVVIDLSSGLRQTFRLPRTGVPRWSGDGHLVSFGGYIVSGGVQLPTAELTWAPTGERAAYVTRQGGARVWSPSGERRIAPDGWGAQGVVWSRDGSLALGRAVCQAACGLPQQTEIWIWRQGSLQRLLASDGGRPVPFAWHNGRVLWWDWPNSGSIAADGVALYENKTRIATALMYDDYVASCGSHLAVAVGGDRFSTHGKRILFDGRDVSRDTTRSWVSPSCTTGRRLVAAAGRNWEETRFGDERRSIWQLLPSRRQLTRPPPGWTDEFPHLLANGDVLFVRTRQVPFSRRGAWWTTTHAKIELLRRSTLAAVATLKFTAPEIGSDFINYYGHYDWPSRIAVTR